MKNKTIKIYIFFSKKIVRVKGNMWTWNLSTVNSRNNSYQFWMKNKIYMYLRRGEISEFMSL